jgi:hypothetical protein
MKNVSVVVLAALLTFTVCDSGADVVQEGREMVRSAFDDFKRRIGKVTQEEVPAGARPRRQTTGPKVVLKGIEIIYNGTPLKFGASIEEWIKIIGEQPRIFEEDFFVWDRLGFFVVMRSNDKEKVKSLHIRLNRRPHDEYNQNMNEIPGEGFSPSVLFQGFLKIYGSSVRSNSTVMEINKGLNDNRGLGKLGNIRQMRCMSGINICTTVVLMGGRRILVGASTSDGKYNGLIYELSIDHTYDYDEDAIRGK